MIDNNSTRKCMYVIGTLTSFKEQNKDIPDIELIEQAIYIVKRILFTAMYMKDDEQISLQTRLVDRVIWICNRILYSPLLGNTSKSYLDQVKNTKKALSIISNSLTDWKFIENIDFPEKDNAHIPVKDYRRLSSQIDLLGDEITDYCRQINDSTIRFSVQVMGKVFSKEVQQQNKDFNQWLDSASGPIFYRMLFHFWQSCFDKPFGEDATLKEEKDMCIGVLKEISFVVKDLKDFVVENSKTTQRLKVALAISEAITKSINKYLNAA